MRILCFSVTPSPYQRDFFDALSASVGCDLDVAYFENAPDDSPWSVGEYQDWESVLPGKVFGKGRVRCHWNAPLPQLDGYDRVIVNAPLTALTTQRLFRRLARTGSPEWIFWGEQLLPRTGWKGVVQRSLAAGLGTAAGIVAIGSRAQDDYRRRFPGVPVHNIPYSCSLSEFRRRGGSRRTSETCRFLFAGQMIARKGVDVLLQAFSSLVADGMDVELQLIGREGDLGSWLEKIDGAVRGCIRYLGFKQPHDLPGLFADADVFVLPSRHDGWGVVVNQALGSGMPVITSTAAGAGRDLVVDGVEGLHVIPGDSISLSRAMRALSADPALRHRMAKAASLKSHGLEPASAAAGWMEILTSGPLAGSVEHEAATA